MKNALQHEHAWQVRRRPCILAAGRLVVFCCLILSGAASACGPEPGGPPAACTGAVAGVEGGGPGASAGNPINVITGNKYQREEDMPALPGVLGLEIVRHYNSAYSQPGAPNGPMGREWKLSYETELLDKFGKIQILQADGVRIIFDRDPAHPGLCSTALPANGRMTLAPQANGATDYTWALPDGRRLHFNTAGKLDRITAASGEALTLLYDPGNVLIKVTDPQGRSLYLGYLGRASARANARFNGVQTIDSPVGSYGYEYGGAAPLGAVPFDTRILWANLLRVRLPASGDGDANHKAQPLVSRVYHHEDPRFPWLLTGISIETSGADGKPVTRRYATYGYDNNGKANLSTHANGVGKVTLDTSAGGKTVLTNSLGQRTVYRHAIVGGAQRLLEVRGAGCATCGESNVRYDYDKLGQLLETITLNASGEALSAVRRELDQLGRTSRVGKVDYQHGKPGPVQWRLRLEYPGDSRAPGLIARPSVVPGKERQTRIVYNQAGQPLNVTELGWIPSYDGKQAAAPLSRNTSYRYATINGRSLLTRIDGPLPNGKTNSPLDSDVTVLEYDGRTDNGNDSSGKVAARAGTLAGYDERNQRKGLLTRIIAPGNLITEVLERDQALRPSKLRLTNGDMVRIASVHSNWRGLPQDIDLTAGTMHRQLHYDYDADGQLQTVTRPGKLRSTFEYDQAGRVSRITLPDGSGIAINHDTEDRTANVTRYDDMQAGLGQALSTTRFDYDREVDKPGQLTGIADTLGQLKSYRYNDIGQVTAIANALGTTTVFDHDAEGRLTSRTDAAGSAEIAVLRLAYDNAGRATRLTAANGVDTLRRYDDFGRKVFEADPDRGVTLFRYDPAGRLLARIDETLSATRYTYDHAGRLLAVGKDRIANLLQYRYRGSQLAGMISTTDGDLAHATERLDYQYDAMGLLIRETRWLAEVGPHGDAGTNTTTKGLLFVTHHEYDEAGRLVHQTLPDGHSLRYRFTPVDDARQEKNAHHRPGQLEAILFDEHIVVGDIECTGTGGLTGYTMSNGARQQILLDQRGRIEQLRTLSGASGAEMGWWRHIAAWLSPGGSINTPPLYRQVNRYDEAGRLVRIERQLAAPDARTPSTPQRENYVYDRLDRLTGIVPDTGENTSFRYDLAGNRLTESVPAVVALATGRPEVPGQRRLDLNFNYARGGNWLLATTQANADGNAPPFVRGVWFYHPTGLPLAQLQWQANGNNMSDMRQRRTVYNSDKRPVAIYDNSRLIARYHYNNQGERIAKTLYPPRPALIPVSLAEAAAPGQTSYTLYREQRLAAETDSRGHITAHYIYLYGKPVAKIDMTENTAVMHSLWKSITRRDERNASDSVAHLYAIVTDHLGTPQQVLDQQQQPVWQAVTAAFGQAHVIRASIASNGKPFDMPLRLPGQVHDAVTGLHYNYLRDYDPMLGRYLTPDPMGAGSAGNPYAYVSNNPLTNIDPLGLYQSDIHYYMTFFLAVAAGVNPEEARLIALATQFIDDNPDTRPLNLSSGLSDAHRARLLSYHFTMVPSSIDEETGLVMGGVTSYGAPPANFSYGNLPESPQLLHLNAAITVAGYVHDLSNIRCTQLQFFGEYLHAFEDTFSHRDSNDMPFALRVGLGHGNYGSNPDYTYNHRSWPPGNGHFNWNSNEDRTLEAEREVFAKLAAWGDSSKAASFDGIEETLRTFNAIHESEASGNTTEEHQTGYPNKIRLLQAALQTHGYTNIDITQKGKQSFNTRSASDNRTEYLHDKYGTALDQKLYRGTILPR